MMFRKVWQLVKISQCRRFANGKIVSRTCFLDFSKQNDVICQSCRTVDYHGQQCTVFVTKKLKLITSILLFYFVAFSSAEA